MKQVKNGTNDLQKASHNIYDESKIALKENPTQKHRRNSPNPTVSSFSHVFSFSLLHDDYYRLVKHLQQFFFR